jgi:hypothetical protein
MRNGESLTGLAHFGDETPSTSPPLPTRHRSVMYPTQKAQNGKNFERLLNTRWMKRKVQPALWVHYTRPQSKVFEDLRRYLQVENFGKNGQRLLTAFKGKSEEKNERKCAKTSRFPSHVGERSFPLQTELCTAPFPKAGAQGNNQASWDSTHERRKTSTNSTRRYKKPLPTKSQ